MGELIGKSDPNSANVEPVTASDANEKKDELRSTGAWFLKKNIDRGVPLYIPSLNAALTKDGVVPVEELTPEQLAKNPSIPQKDGTKS